MKVNLAVQTLSELVASGIRCIVYLTTIRKLYCLCLLIFVIIFAEIIVNIVVLILQSL